MLRATEVRRLKTALWSMRGWCPGPVVPYLLMVRAHRLYRQPTGVHRKNVYNSIFPSSTANSDGRIGFYAKFYVRNNITGSGSLQNLDRGAAAERKYLKK
jgi:hypothetical protein